MPSFTDQFEDAHDIVVGFDFTGDAVLDGTLIPLTRGLTTVYGVNGAGKSRLLRGMSAALSGTRDDVEIALIVRVPRVQLQTFPYAEVHPRGEDFVNALARSILASGFGSDDGPHALRYGLVRDAPGIIEAYLRECLGEEPEDFVAEILESRHLLMVPTGTPEHPSWDAWPVADAFLPAARRVQQEVDAAAQQLRETLPDEILDPDGWAEAVVANADLIGERALFEDREPMNVVRNRQALRWPARFSPYLAGEDSLHTRHGLELIGPLDFGVSFFDLEQDPVSATEAHLGRAIEAIIEDHDAVHVPGATAGGDSSGSELLSAIESEAHRRAQALTLYADEFLKNVLPDAPTVALRISPPSMRLISAPSHWVFGGHELPLEDLSRAEQQ